MIPIVVLLILAVLLIGGIVLMVVLLSNEKTRPIGYALLGVGFVGVLLVGGAGISWTRADREMTEAHLSLDYESEGESSEVVGGESSRPHGIGVENTEPNTTSDEAIELSNNQPRPPEPPKSDTAPPTTAPPPKPTETANSASPTTPQPSTVKPAWIDQTDFVAPNGTYETKVSVGPYQTQLECIARLDAALIQATNEYITEFLYQGNRAESPVRLPLGYIRRSIMTGETHTERTAVRSLDGRVMVTLHVRMRFSPEVQQVLKQQQKDTVLTGKLWYTGLGACLVLTGLLTLFSYLKLDTATKGFYTRRLQFSAGVVILAIMAMGYLLLQGAIVEPLMYGILPF